MFVGDGVVCFWLGVVVVDYVWVFGLVFIVEFGVDFGRLVFGFYC